MQFFHYVTLYHSVLTNLYGKDRHEALATLEDDEKFDRWLSDFERKSQAAHQASERGKGGGEQVSRAQYLKHHARVIGGEEE